ncbi:MAG: PAS domain-containing protein, partial [Leptolyngbyaceae cyanobacterium bins.59]|nr:PAS domain-containing protein [Leptolyngbyaceae cyanobacterium bins.59]
MYSQPSPQPVSSKQADWLQLLTEINPAPVVFSRISDGMILYVTDRATQLFGWAVGEIFDFHHINLYPDPADRVLFLEQLSRNGTVQDCTVQIFCRDGTSFWGVISIEQRLFQGEPIAVTLIRDVTETMMLERQIQERTAQLQQILSFEATLKRITDKVRDSLDENQIIQTAVRELAV